MHNMFFCFTENNLTYSNANSQIQMILKERCDGNRNILHACVNMCSPTSNKETEQGNTFVTQQFYYNCFIYDCKGIQGIMTYFVLICDFINILYFIY